MLNRVGWYRTAHQTKGRTMTSTATIRGPLQAGLHRDETGEIRLNYRHRTAEDFVLAAALLVEVYGR